MNSTLLKFVFLLAVTIVRLCEIVIAKHDRILFLEYELKELRSKVDKLEFAYANVAQGAEANGDDNRYFFYKNKGYWPNEKEALQYYIENGGAVGHAARRAEKKARYGLALI